MRRSLAVEPQARLCKCSASCQCVSICMLTYSVALHVGPALCMLIAFQCAPAVGKCMEPGQIRQVGDTSVRLTRKLPVQAVQSTPLAAMPPMPTPGFMGGAAEPAAQQYQQGTLPQWQPQQLPQQLLQQQVRSLPNAH